MRHFALLLALALTGCGGGTETMSVQLTDKSLLPAPFVIDMSKVTLASGPVVTFVIGPVSGPIADITTPIISTKPVPNWCTDGFVIGPCVPRCAPDQFVIGPC